MKLITHTRDGEIRNHRSKGSKKLADVSNFRSLFQMVLVNYSFKMYYFSHKTFDRRGQIRRCHILNEQRIDLDRISWQ